MALCRNSTEWRNLEALITIYKAFVRPHLDYGDIIYDQVYKESFHLKLELISMMLHEQ